MKQQSCRLSSATLIVALFGSAVTATAGSLTPPPGPIQPTNRVQINQQFGALPIIIDEPGSYVLTGNIVAPAGYTGNGIEINASDVTLDLNGFSVIGVAGSGDGVRSDPSSQNITIRNGEVLSWGGAGVNVLSLADSEHLCENVRATNNLFGIIIGRGGTITRCAASNNGSGGIGGAGNITISQCTANENGGASGIVVSDRPANIIDCHASRNTGYGIQGGSAGGNVIGNTCYENGTPAGNSGGILLNIDFRVEGNYLLGNIPNGIEAVFAGNTIVKNVVMGSANNYVIAAGNDVGPISTAAAATSPWANITD